MMDGCEHLDQAFSMVSSGFLRAAEDYRQRVLDVAINGGVNSIGMPADNLERLKAELDSIAHERVVVDVLTRDILRDNKLGENSRKMKASAMKSKAKTLMDPIFIPEYMSEQVLNANHIVKNNMKELMQQKSRGDLKGGIVIRNSSLGLVVPSARMGLPVDIASLKTAPSSLPKRSNVSKSKGDNDVIYELLSEELCHKNSVVKRELNSMKSQLDELKNKKQPRGKAWGKEQLKGLIDLTVSKYAAAMEKVRVPASSMRNKEVEAVSFPEKYESTGQAGAPLPPALEAYGETPHLHAKLSEDQLAGYTVKVARRYTGEHTPPEFIPFHTAAVPTDNKSLCEVEVEAVRDDIEEVGDALINAAKLMGVDGEYMMVMDGSCEDVRWVRQPNVKYDALHGLERYSNRDTESSSRDIERAVVMIRGQQLEFEGFGIEDRQMSMPSLLKYERRRMAATPPVTASTPEKKIPVDIDEELLRQNFNMPFAPRPPWPLLSKVRLLRRLDEVPPTTELAEEEVVEEKNSPSLIEEPEPTKEVSMPVLEAPTSLIGLLHNLVESHQTTIQTNYDMVNRLLLDRERRHDSAADAVNVEAVTKEISEFYSPLARAAIDQFIAVYDRHSRTVLPTTSSGSRRVKLVHLLRALQDSSDFAYALEADERYDELTVEALLRRLEERRRGVTYIALSDLIAFLENSSDTAGSPFINPPATVKEPTAVDFIEALTRAVSEVADQTTRGIADGQRRAVLEKQEVAAAVRAGVNEGLAEALARLEGMVPKAVHADEAQFHLADEDEDTDESFFTYLNSEGTGDDELSLSGVSFEATHRGLLHARGFGLAIRKKDPVVADMVDSRQHAVDLMEDSDDSFVSVDEDSGEKRVIRGGRAVRLSHPNILRRDSIGSSSRTSSSSSSSSAAAMPQKCRSAPPAAVWDHHGRRIRPLAPPVLISRKAGCRFTLAAQEIGDESVLGSFTLSSSSLSRSATRYSRFDVNFSEDHSFVYAASTYAAQQEKEYEASVSDDISGSTGINSNAIITTHVPRESRNPPRSLDGDASAEDVSCSDYSVDDDDPDMDRQVQEALGLAKWAQRTSVKLI
jgi:hypothetical protein